MGNWVFTLPTFSSSCNTTVLRSISFSISFPPSCEIIALFSLLFLLLFTHYTMNKVQSNFFFIVTHSFQTHKCKKASGLSSRQENQNVMDNCFSLRA